MKSLKNLFIKDGSEDEEPQERNSFPVNESNAPVSQNNPSSNPYFEEIAGVYEKGMESMNMPGYDFYDFYLAIKASGAQTESVYKMAFQMGKTLDANISPQKLATDGDYYIGKLKEVFESYSEKGKQKLNSLAAELKSEKDALTTEINHVDGEITRLKELVRSMEQKLSETKSHLSKVESKYKPQQDIINQKLQANEQVMQINTKILTSIKEGVAKFIK